MEPYQELYSIRLLDDIHNFFPAFLYEQNRFRSVQDVFQYMNSQIAYHCNPFTRGQREYNRQHATSGLQGPPGPPGPAGPPGLPGIPSVQPRTTARTREIIDIVPIFTQYLNPQSTPATPGTAFLTEYLMSMLQQPRNVMDPVIVRPTVAQVEASTTLRPAMAADEEECCSICQDTYTEGQAIRTITHCAHNFHKTCIDTWFTTNVHCPDCRHDIRTQAI